MGVSPASARSGVRGLPALFRKASRSTTAGVIGMWGFWSVTVLSLAATSARLPIPDPNWWPPELVKLAPPLARWDSGWYYGIAVAGYQYDYPMGQNNIAFYPLYPFLARWIAAALGTPVFETGIGLSLLCLLGALVFLGKLVQIWGAGEAVRPTAQAILVYPSAFFFAAFYTESLFLLTTVAAIWAARRGRWLVSGLAGAAAALTRHNGIFVFIPILVLVWKDAGPRLRNFRAAHLAALGAPLLGAVIYPLYLWDRWGSPFLYLTNKTTGWVREVQWPWVLFSSAVSEAWYRVTVGGLSDKTKFWLEFVSLFLFTFLAVLLIRRRLLAEGLYCAATLLMLWGSGSLDGMQRFVLVLFPCFFVLADFLRRHPVLSFAYTVVGIGFGTLLLTRFIHWIFVA